MSSPVEYRYYLRRFTIADLKAGLQPLQQRVGPVVNGQAPTELFAPPQLQYRYKEKVHVDGKPTLEWSDWIDVPFVREGEDLQTAPAGV